MSYTITIRDGDARRYLARLRSGAEGAATRVMVGSNLRYAYGIEHGVDRRGKVARRAGGAFMLRNALLAVQPRLRKLIAAALPNGAAATARALLKAGYDVERGAKAATPVRTGTLRRSIHTVAGGR